MAVDYSKCKFPKARVQALEKQDRVKQLATKDRAENAKARARAKGQCEVRQIFSDGLQRLPVRCPCKDMETHHLIGGIGRRNRGKSILAVNKLRVCLRHHAEITAHIMKPTTEKHDALTVIYWRAT